MKKNWKAYEWSPGRTMSISDKASLSRLLMASCIINIVTVTFLYTVFSTILLQIIGSAIHVRGYTLSPAGQTVYMGVVIALYVKDVIKSCIPVMCLQKDRFIWRTGTVEKKKLRRLIVDEQSVSYPMGQNGTVGEKVLVIGIGGRRKRFKAYRKEYL